MTIPMKEQNHQVFEKSLMELFLQEERAIFFQNIADKGEGNDLCGNLVVVQAGTSLLATYNANDAKDDASFKRNKQRPSVTNAQIGGESGGGVRDTVSTKNKKKKKRFKASVARNRNSRQANVVNCVSHLAPAAADDSPKDRNKYVGAISATPPIYTSGGKNYNASNKDKEGADMASTRPVTTSASSHVTTMAEARAHPHPRLNGATPPREFPSDHQLRGYDIICGRHKLAFNNCANRRFRVTISIFLPAYLAVTCRIARSKVMAKIMDTIWEAGGHFLKEKEDGNGWMELSLKEVRNKVGHALRDAASVYRQEQAEANNPLNKQEAQNRAKTDLMSCSGTLGESSPASQKIDRTVQEELAEKRDDEVEDDSIATLSSDDLDDFCQPGEAALDHEDMIHYFVTGDGTGDDEDETSSSVSSCWNQRKRKRQGADRVCTFILGGKLTKKNCLEDMSLLDETDYIHKYKMARFERPTH